MYTYKGFHHSMFNNSVNETFILIYAIQLQTKRCTSNRDTIDADLLVGDRTMYSKYDVHAVLRI